jgi:hypothetical protein
MAGSDHSGEEMQSGRVNRAEHQTQIWAQEESGKAFPGTAILIVAPAEGIEDSDFQVPNARLDAVVGRGSGFGAGVKGHGGLVGVLGEGEKGPGVEGHGAPPDEAESAGKTRGGIYAEDRMAVVYSAGVLGCGGNRALGRPHGPGVLGIGGYIPDKQKDKDGEPTGEPLKWKWPDKSEDKVPNNSKVFGDAGVAGQGSPGGPDPHKPGPGVVGLGGAPTTDTTFGGAGVVGLSRPSRFEESDYEPPTNTGVYGDGPTGMVAKGRNGPGMKAYGSSSKVIGTIVTLDPALHPGVIGKGGTNRQSTSFPEPGGLKTDESENAAGVVGLAGDQTEPPLAEMRDIGVLGIGRTGVLGRGRDGPDVGEETAKGLGGVFESQRAAQVRLVPLKMHPVADEKPFTPKMVAADQKLPHDGQAGDLLATVDNNNKAKLWFCVRGVDKSGPARWAQVGLAEDFAGTT